MKDPNPWTLGYAFMYDNWEEYIHLFRYGRCAIIFFGCVLGYLIFKFGSELYGRAGGLFSLLLYVLNPNILAHSGLATIDIGASCIILLSIYCFWKYLKRRDIYSLVFTGIALGLAQLSKFTALLLYPIFFIIVSVIAANRVLTAGNNRYASNGATNKEKSTLPIMIDIGWLSLIFIISILVINAGYLFSGTFTALGDYHFLSQNLNTISSLLFEAFPVPVPYDYLTGFDSQLAISEGNNPFYSSYLMGEHSLTGWWYYYFIAFLVKSPPALLIVIPLAIYFHITTRSSDNLHARLCLWIPIACYILYFSLFSHIYIGIRFLFPVFPLVFIAAGIIGGSSLLTRKRIKYFIAAVILSCIVSVVFSYPNYISYFNIFSGGSSRGHEWLIDSNLDWGQDLPKLKEYMENNGIEDLKLGYFGRVDPELYDIKYTLAEKNIEKRVYAISINFLKRKPYYLLDNRNKKLIYADRDYFKNYSKLKPVTVINNTIYIFDNSVGYSK
ncbi:glycosyltransferase family 39 protein [Thermodesulfobacteriota bacterium]